MVTQSPEFFNRGPSSLVRLLFFTALAVACMVADARFRYLPGVRASLATFAFPLQQAALAPNRLLQRINNFFVTQNQLEQENAQLKRDLLLQAEALQRANLLEAELASLKKMLGARARLEETALLAEVIHAGRNPFSRKVVVDKGTRAGVVAGQAVIDADGVLGQVTQVFPFAAEVTLLTDKDQAVPVISRRNGLRAVVFGNGQGATLDLPFVPVNADVQNGDLLVTSGLDGTYPAGLAVAKVTNIERNVAYVFAKITCTPSAGVDNNRHMLVLSNRAAESMPKYAPALAEKKPAVKASKSAKHQRAVE